MTGKNPEITPSDSPVLQGEALRHSYGKREVLRSIDIRIQPGRLLGLLGPNGAGKTTCIHLLAGILPLRSGRIFLDGIDVGRDPLYRRARLGLGYLPQEPSIFHKLRVRENLELVLEENGVPKAERADRIAPLLQRFGLDGQADQRAGTLSGGERRRLEIARVLSLRPKVLLFDEPFSGIDPLTVATIQSDLIRLAEEGIGILITDHNVRETLRICNHAIILHQGEILARGTPSEVARDPETRERFLGKDFELDR